MDRRYEKTVKRLPVPKPWIPLLLADEEAGKLFLEQDENEYDDDIVPPYFFHLFRPDQTQRLRPYFTPFPCGEEVFAGVKEIFDATADHYMTEDGTVYAYFVPRYRPSSETELRGMARDYVEGLNRLFILLERKPLDFEQIELREMKREEFESAYRYEETYACELNDEVGDWFAFRLEENAPDHPLTEFKEAMYLMACDYWLYYFMCWPLLRIESMTNPFLPYLNFWKTGRVPVIVTPNLIVLSH